MATYDPSFVDAAIDRIETAVWLLREVESGELMSQAIGRDRAGWVSWIAHEAIDNDMQKLRRALEEVGLTRAAKPSSACAAAGRSPRKAAPGGAA
jgi:hypothetical protein